MQLTQQQQERITQVLRAAPLKKALDAIIRAGGRAYLVGGAVRDLFLGTSLEDIDIDIEVHNLSLEQLAAVLQTCGPVDYVGKSFGVLKLHGTRADWVLPRVDSAGRKPEVTVRHDLSITQALQRRDLTMNAMAVDLHSFEFYDPFGGREDMQNKILRSPDVQFFTQDPLRFYRVMQFVGRFEMLPDAALEAVCKTMDIATISKERIAAEFEKLFMKSVAPSQGIRWLMHIGRMTEILPELAQLRNVPQEPEFHPEGDVLEHSLQALDAAAILTYTQHEQKKLIVYAALCHDLGKFSTTHMIDGRWRSYGHEVAGVPLARALMRRITINKELQENVCALVRHHMAPGALVKCKASLAAYKRLARKLAPDINLQTLSLLAYADRRGRNGAGHTPLTVASPDIEHFVARAEEAGVLWHAEKPLITGADLMDVIPPGPALGEAVRHAYEIQINKNIKDKAELKKRVLSKQ